MAKLYWDNTELKKLSGELWESIPGYDGLYEASSLGRIKSVERLVPNGNGAERLVKAKILKQSINSGGQPVVVLYGLNRKPNGYAVESLIGITFLGYKKEGEVYCHKNKIKMDNRLRNLFIASKAECQQLNLTKGIANLYEVWNHPNSIQTRFKKNK